MRDMVVYVVCRPVVDCMFVIMLNARKNLCIIAAYFDGGKWRLAADGVIQQFADFIYLSPLPQPEEKVGIALL